MPSPSTHDEHATPRPGPLTAEGVFSSPAGGAGLEDTRPFSLLNALLADVPDAVRYVAPPFKPLPKPEVVEEPTAGQLAAALLKEAAKSPKPQALESEPKDREVVEPEPAGQAFPKLDDTPSAPRSWPKRGFLSSPSRSKPSADPLNKAIRIFESLSPKPSAETDSLESADGANESSEAPLVSDPEPRPAAETTVDEVPSTEEPEAEKSVSAAAEDSLATEVAEAHQTPSTKEDPAAEEERQDEPTSISEPATAPMGLRPEAGPIESPFTLVGPAGQPIGAQSSMPFVAWPKLPVQAKPAAQPKAEVQADPPAQAEAPVQVDPPAQAEAPVQVDPPVEDEPSSAAEAVSPPATHEVVVDPADQPTTAIDLAPPLTHPSEANVARDARRDIKGDIDDDEAVTQRIELRAPNPTPPPSPPPPPRPQAVPPREPKAEKAKEEPASAWSLNAARVFLTNSEARQESVDDKVASLLEILERVLPDRSTPTVPVHGAHAAPTIDDPNEAIPSDASASTKDETIEPLDPPSVPKPKIQLRPRTTTDKEDFGITAPVTLVSAGAPVSPFTKVAAGSAKDIRPASPLSPIATQRSGPPQVPTVSVAATPPAPGREHASPKPAVPKPPSPGMSAPQSHVASPFSVAAQKARVHPNPVAKPHPEFASPFSSAMKKPPSAEARRLSPMVAPITPPGDDILPPPSYSFSGLDTESVKAQVPDGPADIPSSVPGDHENGRARRRQEATTIDQEPEKPSWGFLSILLGCICAIFLVLYIFEFYKQLRDPPNRLPAPIPPDVEDVVTPASATKAQLIPSADVDLREPLDAIKGFLKATTVEARLPFVIEGASVIEPMRHHYASFGGLEEALPDTMALVGGSAPGDQPEYVIAQLHWKERPPLNIRLFRQNDGSHQFSWYAFEQWRHRLLERFVVGEWAEWSHFYVEIRPTSTSVAPELPNQDDFLWYQLTSPENPAFSINACLPLASPLAKEFSTQFQADRKYEVVLTLERLLDEQGTARDYLLITRLLNARWEP